MVAPNTYTIIMIDIVRYTMFDQVKQLHLFRELQKEINYIFYEELADDQAIVIPLGDGMIIAINERVDSSYLKNLLNKIIRIFKWAENKEFKLRCALNTGSGYQVKDINKNKNIVGDIINDTNRLLSDIGENTIVISESFYRKFLKKGDLVLGVEFEEGNINFKIVDEDYIIDKHGNFHRTFAIALKDKTDNFSIGDNGKILSKYLVKVYSKEYTKEQNKKEKFFEMVKGANDLHFIGLCHSGLIETLNQIEANQHKEVVIRVYFPNDSIMKQIVEVFAFDRNEYNIDRKKEVIEELKKWLDNHPDKKYISLEIYEYSEFLTFGASTIDLDSPDKGFIHISHYLKGISPKDTPYMEIYWKTQKMPPLYKLYKYHLQRTVFGISKKIFPDDGLKEAKQ